MKLTNLHLLTAVLATVLGLALLIFPHATLAMYDITTDDAGVYISRLLGATWLGLGVLTWKARERASDGASRAIIAGLATANVIALPISIYQQWTGAVNALGWTTVAIFGVLAIGYLYFTFSRPDARGSVPAHG